MIVPEKLKINKFKEVRIPTKGEYFNTGRFTADAGKYGGDELADMAAPTTKVDDAILLMEELDKERQKAANDKSE